MKASEAFELYEKSNQKEVILAKIKAEAKSGKISTAVHTATMSSALRRELQKLGYSVEKDVISTAICWDPVVTAREEALRKNRRAQLDRAKKKRNIGGGS